MVNIEHTVHASFLYREISAQKLVSLLTEAMKKQGSDVMICVNRVGNLTVFDDNGANGYIDFCSDAYIEPDILDE